MSDPSRPLDHAKLTHVEFQRLVERAHLARSTAIASAVVGLARRMAVVISAAPGRIAATSGRRGARGRECF